MRSLSREVAERLAVAVIAILLAGLALIEPVAQPPQYHRFADTRTLSFGAVSLPHASNVLTSVAFFAAGLAGLACCSRSAPGQRMPLRVFFAGLAVTGLGSAWYHLAPTDGTLVWDRLAMALGFSGAVGALAAERLGGAAGSRWLLGWLALGIVSVLLWVWLGDLRLYLVAQFGGFGVLLIWFRLPPLAGMVRLPWGWLLVAYVIAKGFEFFDGQTWELTGRLVSGHALKHLIVAFGVLPMLSVLRKQRARVTGASQSPTESATS